MKKIKLFTHGSDLDGIGCAIVGILAFNKENIDIEYCNYNDINEKIKKFIDNKEYKNYNNVFITDISVNKENAEKINKISCNDIWLFNLLDHHETSKWLNDYEWTNIIINLNDKEKTSGTKLFYDYLISNNLIKFNDVISQFVEIVRQYDTWEWKNIYNNQKPKQWNDLLYIMGKDEFINNIIYRLKTYNIFDFCDFDLKLLKYKQNKINEYIENKNKELIIKNIQGYKAGIIFAEQYISELGNKICELRPQIDFIAIINISKAVSYRSIGNKCDVSKIASIFDGGGHFNASGSSINNELKENIINLIFKNK